MSTREEPPTDASAHAKEPALRVLEGVLDEATRTSLCGASLDTPISDLGLSSVAMLEVVAAIEEQLGLAVPDERLLEIRTLGDLARLVSDAAPPR